MKTPLSTCIILGLALSCFGAATTEEVPVWTDSGTAAKEAAGFPMVGEYVSKDGKTAIQANLLKDGDFLVATYQGGLPGAGWDRTPVKSEKMDGIAVAARLAGYTQTERQSPTLGKPAPADALLVFPDDFSNVKDGLLLAGGQTTKELESFHMHLEFMLPFKPGVNPSSQQRGNSGIYIFNNYELQVIDSFALDYENPENNAIKAESLNSQWCGSLYKMKRPDINLSFPPLRWQTYDIDFTAPVFDGDKKVKNARISVFHNGVKIHDDVELPTGTGNGANQPQLAKGPIMFQDHGNPIIYRNVWAAGLK